MRADLLVELQDDARDVVNHHVLQLHNGPPAQPGLLTQQLGDRDVVRYDGLVDREGRVDALEALGPEGLDKIDHLLVVHHVPDAVRRDHQERVVVLVVLVLGKHRSADHAHLLAQQVAQRPAHRQARLVALHVEDAVGPDLGAGLVQQLLDPASALVDPGALLGVLRLLVLGQLDRVQRRGQLALLAQLVQDLRVVRVRLLDRQRRGDRVGGEHGPGVADRGHVEVALGEEDEDCSAAGQGQVDFGLLQLLVALGCKFLQEVLRVALHTSYSQIVLQAFVELFDLLDAELDDFFPVVPVAVEQVH